MAKMLEYCRKEEPADPGGSRGSVAVVVLGALAGICFLLPFGLFELSQWFYPNDPERAALVIAIPVMLLWLAAGLLGLGGTVAGVWALRHDRPRIWTIASTSICGVIMLVAAMHVIRGILQTLRHAS